MRSSLRIEVFDVYDIIYVLVVFKGLIILTVPRHSFMEVRGHLLLKFLRVDAIFISIYSSTLEELVGVHSIMSNLSTKTCRLGITRGGECLCYEELQRLKDGKVEVVRIQFCHSCGSVRMM